MISQLSVSYTSWAEGSEGGGERGFRAQGESRGVSRDMAHESGPAADEGDGGNGTAVAGGVGMNRLRDKLEECLGASKALTTPECAARLREVMAEEYGLVGRIALARIVQANCDDSATRENVRSIVPSSDSQPGVLRLLVQWIDEAHQEHKNSALNRMLSALKALPITVEDLSATNAGTVVNKLKRSEGVDNECKQTASDIVKRWRVRPFSLHLESLPRIATFFRTFSHTYSPLNESHYMLHTISPSFQLECSTLPVLAETPYIKAHVTFCV